MKIKKYDRFMRENGFIIEATENISCGTRVWKVIRDGNVPTRAGEFYLWADFEITGSDLWKKIPRSDYPHPLFSEIAAELRNKPEFEEKLIKFIVDLISISGAEEKNKTFKLFKKHVPVEWFMTLETMINAEE